MSKRGSSPSGDPMREPVIERPDGFYWQDSVDGKLYGPFPSRDAALEDLLNEDTEGEFEEGETLENAEAEIGISDWIDPDTGLPAEETTPRLSDE